MIRTVRCLLALIPPLFRCSTVPLQARTRNGTTTATLRVIYPATNLGPGRATQHLYRDANTLDQALRDVCVVPRHGGAAARLQSKILPGVSDKSNLRE